MIPAKAARASILVALMVAVVVLIPTPASAASTTESHDTEYAVLIFASTDATGCIQSQVVVSVANRVDKLPGGPAVASSTADSLQISSVDVCSNTYLVSAQAFSVPVPAETLQIGKKLSGATMQGSVEVCDFFSGICLPMNFSLTVTPTAPTTSNRQVIHSSDGTTKITETIDRSDRQTTGTGSITYGGVEYVQGPAFVGGMGILSDRIVAVTH